MKRLIISVLAAALMLLPLCACSNTSHIEDTNGAADTSLCALTDEELASSHPRCFTQGALQSHKNDDFTFQAQKMSGVTSLHKFTAEADKTYKVESSITLESGNLRLYILCGGEIIKDIPVGSDQTVTLSGITGKCDIRIAGESARYHGELNFTKA